MRGYAELGVPHIMFQCVPFTEQSVRRLTEALHLYRDQGTEVSHGGRDHRSTVTRVPIG